MVVTHHSHTYQVVAPHQKGSALNSAFACEYGELIANSRIDALIYGHSHTNIDIVIGGRAGEAHRLMGDLKIGYNQPNRMKF